MIDVALLGTGGMMPLPNRFLTSFLLRLNGQMLLIDCGEGTQVSLRMLGWGFKAIDVICLTHFHADHIAGLIGILLTIGNAQRIEPLTIIGPIGVRDVVNKMRVIAPELSFEINFIELSDEKSELITLGQWVISSLPLLHRIPCLAYSIELKRRGKFDISKAHALGIPMKAWSLLQKEDEVLLDGVIYTSDMVLGPLRKSLKISYCTDTRPIDELIPFVYGSDLFVCEGMYGDDEKISNAIKYKHMTFSEAANLACEAYVSELWLTHFSPSLTEPFSFLEKTCKIFKNTVIGEDRMSKSLHFVE